VSLKVSSGKVNEQRVPKVTASNEFASTPKFTPSNKRSKFSSMKSDEKQGKLKLNKGSYAETRSAEFINEVKSDTPKSTKKSSFAEIKKPRGDEKIDVEEGPLSIILSPSKNKASPVKHEETFVPNKEKRQSFELNRGKKFKLTPVKTDENVFTQPHRERRSSFAPENRKFYYSPARSITIDEVNSLQNLRNIARQAYALDIDLNKSCISL
jgi:hypothetical protein